MANEERPPSLQQYVEDRLLDTKDEIRRELREKGGSQDQVTRNGLRTWQMIGAAAITLAMGAVAWNYNQLITIKSGVERVENRSITPEQHEALRNLIDAGSRQDADLKAAVGVIQSRQQVNERRISALELLSGGVADIRATLAELKANQLNVLHRLDVIEQRLMVGDEARKGKR